MEIARQVNRTRGPRETPCYIRRMTRMTLMFRASLLALALASATPLPVHAQGLPPEMAALCDVNVKIPMRGRADSLNLSVATGIMIYAAT